jgi:integrase
MTNLTTFADLAASLKSPKTSEIYQYALQCYMSYRKVGSFTELLELDKTPRLIQSYIIEYLVYLKQVRNTSWSFRNIQLAAIKHWYRMNDFEELNWFKISKYLGEHNKVVNDRGYKTEEIQQILLKADERMRVIILLLASTGIRVGAIPCLRLRALSKIEEYSLYQITVYENTQEQYIAFCTPECAAAIGSYLSYRERYGEKLKPDTPLIREQFNIYDLNKIHTPKLLTSKTIGTFLTNLLDRSGVISIKHHTESSYKERRGKERKEIARAHGFRKFTTTNMIRAKVNPEVREMILGHSIGLGNSYYRPTSNELLEEYLKAVDLLTINEENRLKRKVKTLTLRVDRLEELQEQINNLNERLGL